MSAKAVGSQKKRGAEGLWKELRASFPVVTEREKSRQEVQLHNNIFGFIFVFLNIGCTSEDFFQEAVGSLRCPHDGKKKEALFADFRCGSPFENHPLQRQAN